MRSLVKIFIVMLIFVIPSLAQAGSKVVGKWQGNIIVEGKRPMFIFMDISSLSPDKEVLTLRYGRPRNCSIIASYGGPLEGTEVFYFTRIFQGGDWCDVNIRRKDGDIRLSITDTGKLLYDINTAGSNMESVVLNRSQ